MIYVAYAQREAANFWTLRKTTKYISMDLTIERVFSKCGVIKMFHHSITTMGLKSHGMHLPEVQVQLTSHSPWLSLVGGATWSENSEASCVVISPSITKFLPRIEQIGIKNS